MKRRSVCSAQAFGSHAMDPRSTDRAAVSIDYRTVATGRNPFTFRERERETLAAERRKRVDTSRGSFCVRGGEEEKDGDVSLARTINNGTTYDASVHSISCFGRRYKTRVYLTRATCISTPVISVCIRRTFASKVEYTR